MSKRATLDNLQKCTMGVKPDMNNNQLQFFELKDLPFKTKRIFSVKAGHKIKRGSHSHKECTQILFCISGEISVICKDIDSVIEHVLKPDGNGLVIPPGIWAEQVYNEDNSVLLVFCDKNFDENDYIRDFDQFLKHDN